MRTNCRRRCAKFVTPGHAGLQEAEAGTAAIVLLAKAVGLLAIVGEPGLDGVRPLDERHIVLHREPRLLRAVVRGRAPGRELGRM